MNNFTNKKILGSCTLGDRLKRSRKQIKLSLEELGKKIKINPEYLYYLENGQYNQLPGTLYIKNYLKKYCLFVGLEWPMMEKIYDREIIIYRKKLPKKLYSKFHQKALILPKIIVGSLIVLLAASLILYAVIEVTNISRPPQLAIYDMQDEQITTEHTINLKGKTDPEAQVSINGQQIIIDEKGYFSEIISLQTGLNNIKVSAKAKHSREKIIYKQILVKNN